MKIQDTGDILVITGASETEKRDILALARNQAIQPHLLTRQEVAEILRCHPKTVERHASSGLIRQIKVGRYARYIAAEIAEFARNGCNPQNAAGVAGSETQGSLEKNNTNGGRHD